MTRIGHEPEKVAKKDSAAVKNVVSGKKAERKMNEELTPAQKILPPSAGL